MRVTGAVFTCLLLLAASAGAAHSQQTRTIRGSVVDAVSAEALSGTAVTVEGTDISALAGADGGFVLTGVPGGTVTVVAQRLGYETVRITVPPEQSEVTISLEASALQLSEIVVTGQATGVAYRNVANAVAVIDEEEVNRTSSHSIEGALQGKVAGVRIRSHSGSPGGGMTVDIRGQSSFLGSQKPLYVVDGVIVSDVSVPAGTNLLTSAKGDAFASNQEDPVNRIGDLSTSDIESINILKGASAAAIYGSKAANGVVVIDTKRGADKPLSYRVTQRLGTAVLQQGVPSRTFESVEEAEAWGGELARREFENSNGQNFDQNELIAGQTPISHETLASVVGGGEDQGVYISALVRHQGGIIDNTYADKQSVRVNYDRDLSDFGHLFTGVNVIHSKNDRGLTGNDNTGISYYGALFTTPRFMDLRQNPDGTFPENPFASSNPLQSIEHFEKPESTWRLLVSQNLDFRVKDTEEQTIRLNVAGGVDYFSQDNSFYSPPFMEYEGLDGELGTAGQSDGRNLNLNLNGNAVWEWSLGEGIQSTAQIGVQYESSDLEVNRIFAENLIGGEPNVDQATTVLVEETRERVEDFGIFFQEELLMLDQRLLLTAGARADRSSANAEDTEFSIFPKASASYRLPVSGVDWLDQLKIRAAFGQSGNRPLYGQKFSPLLGSNVSGVAGTRIGTQISAPDLKPERQTEFEGGVDAVGFGSRVNLNLTGYQKTIDDVLLRRDLPPTSGFTSLFFNGGSFRIRGFEAGVDVVPLRTSEVQWNMSASFDLSRCQVTDLPVPSFFPGQFLGAAFGAWQIEEGESCTQLVGNDSTPDGEAVLRKIGDSRPDFSLTYATDFTFKDFSFDMLWDWQQGGRLLNITQFELDLSGLSPDCDVPTSGAQTVCERRFSAWPKQSAVYQQEATFLKLREAKIEWSAPESFVSGFLGGGVDALSVSLSGRNLLLFTPYTTGDPEHLADPGNFTNGSPWDIWTYPPSREFWLSLSASF